MFENPRTVTYILGRPRRLAINVNPPRYISRDDFTALSNTPHSKIMSITRQLLNEFRPLFRMFDEPFARSPAAFSRSPFFDEAFTGFPRFSRPAIDVREEGNSYIVEADLPGVQKENVEVSVGDGGRSVTIEGKIVTRSPPQAEAKTEEGEKTGTLNFATTIKNWILI